MPKDKIDYEAAIRKFKRKNAGINYEAAAKKMWDGVKQRDRQNPNGAKIFTEFCPNCGEKLAGSKCPRCKLTI